MLSLICIILGGFLGLGIAYLILGALSIIGDIVHIILSMFFGD